MISMRIEKIVDNTDELLKAMAALVQNDVLVGIPEEKTERHGDEPTNALLGYVHEHGSPTQNIPPRPFLAPGIQDAKDGIAEGMRKAGEAALDGNKSAVLANLNCVGLIASAAVKLRINNGPFVPLKPATLAARRRKGFLGTKPLIRTAQLRNAVSYVIWKRKA